MGKPYKLIKVQRNKDIIAMRLKGVSVEKIAETYGLDVGSVASIINKEMKKARDHLVQDAESLLAKSYMRLDVLIDKLMSEVDDADNSLRVIDRVDKLINTQIKLITGLRTRPVQSADGHVVEQVFTTQSDEYELALTWVQQNGDFELPEKELTINGIRHKKADSYSTNKD